MKRRSWNPYWPFSPQELAAVRGPLPSSPCGPEKLLRVETDYFVAGALFRKIYGVWSCTQAAPILKWMVGKRPLDIKLALLRMAAKFTWVSPQGEGMGESRQLLQVATHQMEGTNPLPGVTNPIQSGKETDATVAVLSLPTDGSTTLPRASGEVIEALVPTAGGVPNQPPDASSIKTPMKAAATAPC